MKNFNRHSSHGHHGSKRRELGQHAQIIIIIIVIIIIPLVIINNRNENVKNYLDSHNS